MRDEIRVKGSVLLGVNAAAPKVIGESSYAAVRKELTGEFAETMRTGLPLASGWYPIEWHRQLLGRLVQQAGPTAMRDTVRLSTRDNVNTINRILMRAFSPDSLLRSSASLFSGYFEAKIVATRPQPDVSRVEWFGCRGFDKNVWQAQLHTTEELITMTGARLKRRNLVSGGTDLDDAMVAEFSYAT